jgi:hypothetical protein
MMKTDSANAPSIPTRRRSPRGDFTVGPEDSGQTLSLAADIGALEECLALERASGQQSRTSDGINSPPAIPYCEFLTLRSGDGRLRAVTRLMRLDGGNPFGNPLATDRFRISPLITAMRYARAGVLEVGNPIVVPGCDPSEAARLLWNGIIGYLDRNGPGFVTGMESIPIAMELAQVWPRLMETHGLPPELEVETRSAWNPRSAMGIGARPPASRKTGGLRQPTLSPTAIGRPDCGKPCGGVAGWLVSPLSTPPPVVWSSSGWPPGTCWKATIPGAGGARINLDPGFIRRSRPRLHCPHAPGAIPGRFFYLIRIP